jgi:dephospho-CoA kinase
MILVGLTGASCAGKNFAARILEDEGFFSLDLDKLGHQALQNRRAELAARFGKDLISADGLVKRHELGSRVFGNPQELAALEAIVHPEVDRLCEEIIAEKQQDLILVNAAVLHKSALFKRLSAVIIVESPLLLRLIRGMRRDRLPPWQLLKRFHSQANFGTQ